MNLSFVLFLDITLGDNNGKHQDSQHDSNDVNQPLLTKDFVQLNQTETISAVDFGNGDEVAIDFNVPYDQNSFPRNNGM